MKITEFDTPVSQVYGASSESMTRLWDGIEKQLEETPHGIFHLTSHWPCYVPRIAVTRFLALYELFKLVKELPGDIVEIGVGRGDSFFSWCKFLEVFSPTDTSRKVIGFDSFEGLTDFTPADGPLAPASDKVVGGWSPRSAIDEVDRLNDLHNANNVCAKVRGMLVAGKVQDTVPTFEEKQRPGMRISLLHVDVDLFAPTACVLDHFYDLIVPGGVVVFDEYAMAPWAGESKAWDVFAKERGILAKWKKFPWSHNPGGYFVKEG
jgi:hypothetical protein